MSLKFQRRVIFRLRSVRPDEAAVFFAVLLLASMIFSPFLLSVSMWGLVFVAIWHSAQVCREAGRMDGKNFWLRAGIVLAHGFRRWWQNRLLRSLSLLFAVVALSGLWSDDTSFWLERTRVRIPFFVVPWAFANLPVLDRTRLRIPFYLLVFAVTLTSIGVGIHLWLHFDSAMEGLRRGQPIPVPRSHIRFSLIMVMAIVCGIWFWLERFYLKYRWERPLLAVCTVFLTGFIHVLSVRSGLAALYAAGFTAVLLWIVKTKRWFAGGIALAVLALAPAVAVRTVPSLVQRMDYMRNDWQKFKSGAGSNYSDSERWVSFQAGWIIFTENPLLGAGAGDLPAEVRRVVNERFPAYIATPKLPHNQFLYIMAGTGLFGLAVSLYVLLMPFFDAKNRKFAVLNLFQAAVFVSFLVEYTLETAIGVAFYIFYLLWFVKMAEDKARNP